jgi:hypothetical protein
VLTLPVQGYDPKTWQLESDLWVLRIDVSFGIQLLGKIRHQTPVRRSVRINDMLYSISQDAVRAQPVVRPENKVGEELLRDPDLSASGVGITTTEGTQFSGTVATFTLAKPDAVQAMITWGDGQFSPGKIQPKGQGGFDVIGSHTYDAAGSLSITVALTRAADSQTFVQTTARVNVDPNNAFLNRLYRDLLHRQADAGGLTFWYGVLTRGTSRSLVVQAFLGSQEYRTNVIQSIYQKVLGRSADSVGLKGWMSYLAGGQTPEQLRAQILGSDEFFTRGNVDSNRAFVQNLYQLILHRSVDPTGARVWGDALAHGTSRSAVAQAILGSSETQTRAVSGWYRQFLGRDADQYGLQLFVGALQRGASSYDVVTGILSSQEYFQRS